MLTEFKRSVKTLVFSEEEMSAKEWMGIHDMAFKLLLDEKEKEIFTFLCECFMDLSDEADRSDPDKEMGEYLIYKAKAKSLSRCVAYMGRFWIPYQRNLSTKVTVRDREIPVGDVYDTLMVLWGDPPTKEEL